MRKVSHQAELIIYVIFSQNMIQNWFFFFFFCSDWLFIKLRIQFAFFKFLWWIIFYFYSSHSIYYNCCWYSSPFLKYFGHCNTILFTTLFLFSWIRGTVFLLMKPWITTSSATCRPNCRPSLPPNPSSLCFTPPRPTDPPATPADDN